MDVDGLRWKETGSVGLWVEHEMGRYGMLDDKRWT